MGTDVDWAVLLWVPNIIGYIRILLCILSVLSHVGGYPVTCIILFSLNFSLDGVDGYLARKLNQTSSFGAWFDVYVDLLSRGFLWIIVNGIVGYAIISWEWLAFFAIHAGFGQRWKTPPKAPPFVSLVMKNNFKTIHGFFVIGSLFLLPMWCYTVLYLPHMAAPWLTYCMQYSILAVLLCGRFIAAAVEGWYITTFLKSLLLPSPTKST